MSKLLDKIKKNSTIKIASVLEDSTFFTDVDETPTEIPALNIALSGSLNGGLKSGIVTIAGLSRHFKTMYGLLMASAYLKKNKDAALLFYDTEFGSPMEYFTTVGIDPARVLHVPIKNLEELKFDIVKQLEAVDKGDKLFIMIDSIGNAASLKEMEDAIDGKSVGDMSRAKFVKGLYRIITPYLRTKDIPLVQIAHIYMTQEMFAKPVVSGGQGILLSSDIVWIIGRSQDKEGTELAGYNFTINVEKSRYVKEKTKIPITVKFEGGISKYSGLLDIALEANIVQKPSNGWYCRVDADGVIESKKWRAKDTDCKEFWDPVLANPVFINYIESTYKVSHGTFLSDESIDEAMENVDVD